MWLSKEKKKISIYCLSWAIPRLVKRLHNIIQTWVSHIFLCPRPHWGFVPGSPVVANASGDSAPSSLCSHNNSRRKDSFSFWVSFPWGGNLFPESLYDLLTQAAVQRRATSASASAGVGGKGVGVRGVSLDMQHFMSHPDVLSQNPIHTRCPLTPGQAPAWAALA